MMDKFAYWDSLNSVVRPCTPPRGVKITVSLDIVFSRTAIITVIGSYIIMIEREKCARPIQFNTETIMKVSGL